MALFFLALGVPALVVATGGLAGGEQPGTRSFQQDGSSPALLPDILGATLRKAAQQGRQTALFLVEVDDVSRIFPRHGASSRAMLHEQLGARLTGVLRSADHVVQMGEGRFALLLHPVAQLHLDSCTGLAARIQDAMQEPLSLNAAPVYLTVNVGFCLGSRAPGADGPALLDAAETALKEARRHGGGAVRGYSPDLAEKPPAHPWMKADLDRAFDAGEFQPWFQPQISTDTGAITGFEALARWIHPEHGPVAPAEFLPLIESAGQMPRLGAVILSRALAAIQAWDRAGLDVPRVAVNFCATELRDPGLVDRIKWELDRFDLAPERLVVEVLETVLATSDDDLVIGNINALAALGCPVDLDDFGTGHASITSLRQFDVARLKIDRSFVTRADRDPGQQRMITTILTMAEKLGLETVAEGVETVGEHAILAQLGCGHVQGFGIARPMPLDHSFDWIEAHLARLADLPPIGRRTG